MKIIKKISFALSVAIITTLLFGVMACYQKEGGSIKEIAGTYKLEKKTEGYDSSGSAQDIIEENKIVEYLVIGENGYGYHVYSDKNTPLSCRQIKIKFIPSEETPSVYEYIEYNHYYGDSTKKLAFYKKERKLNFGTPALKSGCVNVEATTVSYKHISDEQSLKTVETELNQKFSYKPYDLYHYTGFFAHELTYSVVTEDGLMPKDSKFIYKILSFDFDKNTVDIYYALKSDRTAQEQKGVSFSYSTVAGENNDIGYMIFTIGTDKYRAGYYGYIYYEFTLDGMECIESYLQIFGDDPAAYAEQKLTEYIAANPQE